MKEGKHLVYLRSKDRDREGPGKENAMRQDIERAYEKLHGEWQPLREEIGEGQDGQRRAILLIGQYSMGARLGTWESAETAVRRALRGLWLGLCSKAFPDDWERVEERGMIAQHEMPDG